jgi:hypothetical protein
MIKQRIVSNFGTISVYKFNVVLSIFRIFNPRTVLAWPVGLAMLTVWEGCGVQCRKMSNVLTQWDRNLRLSRH